MNIETIMESRETQPLPHTIIPYVPPEIDLDDLNDNFCLLTERQLAEIDERIPVNVDRRVSKKTASTEFGIALPYSLIVHDGQAYILYKGRKQKKQAGVGDFGVVKYIQHAKTKRWYVIKNFASEHINFNGVERERHPNELKAFVVNEHAALQKLKMAVGHIGYSYRESLSKGRQFYIIMCAAKGYDLFDYIEKFRRRLHPHHMLALLQSACKVVESMHRLGLVHRDIKQDNMRFEVATAEVTLIDFGLAVTFLDNMPRRANQLFGARDKLAPEIFKGDYSVFSDTFAIGATLADLLGFLNIQNDRLVSGSLLPRELINRTQPVTLLDKSSVLALYDLCARMMSPLKSERLSIQEAIANLTSLQNKIQCGPLSVAILDVSHYLRVDIKRRAEIIQNISSHCHELVLVGAPNLSVSFAVVKLMDELQNAGLRVYNKLYHEQDSAAILSHLKSMNPSASWTLFVMPKQLTNETPAVTLNVPANVEVYPRPFFQQGSAHRLNKRDEVRHSLKPGCIML